jgi:hypothetical protein
MIAVWAILGALAILAYWAGILWIGARLDRPYLEREKAERVIGEEER